MKPIYLLLIIALPLLSISSYAQKTQEENRWIEVLQTADTSSLISFMRQFEPKESWEPLNSPLSDIKDIQKNDTAREANAVMRTVLKAYKSDQLKGNSHYNDMTQWPRLIVIQPEVKVCFVSESEIDYRSIFSGKYFGYDIFTYDNWLDAHQSGSRLDRFPPCYNDIPKLTDCKTYRYYKRNSECQFITLDTLMQIRIEKYVLNNVDRLDRKKINAVIPIKFGRVKLGERKGKPFSSLSYNIWIEKIIFNSQLDQCIVQASTLESSYEMFLLKIRDEWTIAHSAEWRHTDFAYY